MVAFPRRGEVFEVNWNPARGSEQAGIRPALVVQNDVGNSSAPTTVVAAITSRLPKKPYPFVVRLPDALLPKPSVVNCSQLYTIDKSRLGRMMAVVPRTSMEEVDQALRRTLSLR